MTGLHDPAAHARSDWAGTRPWIWGLVFALGMGLIAGLERFDLIGRPWNLILVALFSLSLWPLARSASNSAAKCGVRSAALERYNRRVMQASFGYVVGLGIAITLFKSMNPQGPLLWLLALLPSVPILFGIQAMARYLEEETDEYLRYRTIGAAMSGLALVIVLGTCWGFLELFGAVPHIPAWWVVPVWALGLGLAQLRQSRRDRSGQDL